MTMGKKPRIRRQIECHYLTHRPQIAVILENFYFPIQTHLLLPRGLGMTLNLDNDGTVTNQNCEIEDNRCHFIKKTNLLSPTRVMKVIKARGCVAVHLSDTENY